MKDRIVKSRQQINYTIIDNDILRNESISFRAKGLFCFLQSLPPDWNINVRTLYKYAKEGRDACISAFNELVEAGVVVPCDQLRKNGEFSHREYVVYPHLPEAQKTEKTATPLTENPLPLTELPLTDSSLTKKPLTDFQALQSKELKSKKEKSKELEISARKLAFIKKVKEEFGNNYDDSLLSEFCDYWTEHSENGKKMAFEKQKTFGISRRLATWKKNEERFGRKKIKTEKFPIHRKTASFDELEEEM